MLITFSCLVAPSQLCAFVGTFLASTFDLSIFFTSLNVFTFGSCLIPFISSDSTIENRSLEDKPATMEDNGDDVEKSHWELLKVHNQVLNVVGIYFKALKDDNMYLDEIKNLDLEMSFVTPTISIAMIRPEDSHPCLGYGHAMVIVLPIDRKNLFPRYGVIVSARAGQKFVREDCKLKFLKRGRRHQAAVVLTIKLDRRELTSAFPCGLSCIKGLRWS